MENSRYSKEAKWKHLRTFSEPLKKQIVLDLEKGKTSVSHICREYNVSSTSVYRWIYKYSPYSKRDQKLVVESKSQQKKIKDLEKKVKELEAIVGQKQIQLDYNQELIKLAEKRYKIDIKKNWAGKYSKSSGKGPDQKGEA